MSIHIKFGKQFNAKEKVEVIFMWYWKSETLQLFSKIFKDLEKTYVLFQINQKC